MLHRRCLLGLAAVALAATGCDRPPTAPLAPPASRPPRLATAADGAVLAQDLGVLPGDVRSEATFITEDGAVYGQSFPTFGDESPRFFRWTQDGGMVEVSSIPQPTSPPLPASLPLPPPPPQWLRAFPLAANTKGEVTGMLCIAECDEPPDRTSSAITAHALRYSAGAGTVDIDQRFGDPPDFEPMWITRGWSINKWGHVAGSFWATDGDPVVFFWTPLPGPRADEFGQFVFVSNNSMTIDFTDMRVNDVDQVIGRAGGQAFEPCAFVWRPDLGTRELLSPGVPCANDEFGSPGRALAQQDEGTLVVGWGNFPGVGVHAALWDVPAVNRAGFPEVNANPLPFFTSTISLARTGGRVYQFYRGTQSPASGPYLELVDWGDGTTSERTRSQLGVTTSQNHVYTNPGTYWVRVYVKDAQGRWDVDERRLTVRQ